VFIPAAHDHQIVRGGVQHLLQAEHFRVGIGWFSDDQQSRRHLPVLRAQFFNHRHGRIFERTDCEQNFELRIILFEKCAQICFQILVETS
jgi:hypothetical protein